jgi:hypothetical protein
MSHSLCKQRGNKKHVSNDRHKHRAAIHEFFHTPPAISALRDIKVHVHMRPANYGPIPEREEGLGAAKGV